MDRPFQHENQIERTRMGEMMARLSDDDLRRSLGSGWTVAAALAHVAFWDQRALLLLKRFEQGGEVKASPVDVDVVNEATLALCLAIPPRAAAQLAIDSAEAVDRELELLPDDLIARIEAAGRPVRLRRAEHRREHLDEIERVLGG